MTEGDRKSLQQALRDTWMSALGVLSGADAEVARAAHRLIESTGLRTDGETPASTKEAAREAKEAVRELFERVRKNRDAFEQRVEEGVKAAVARVHKPLEKELATLRGRLEALQKRVEELSKRR